ncbi:MAG: hypothetical protein JWN79_472 [Gemmatimonadetes bacterium]|jgi:hypothetical protein|nr:hypothetical protein [Gemmatimonadota bacterium]
MTTHALVDVHHEGTMEVTQLKDGQRLPTDGTMAPATKTP